MAQPRKKTRRERGTGSIVTLREGVHKLKWSVTVDGKRQQRYRTVHGSLADAKRELRLVVDELPHIRPHVPESDALVADFVGTWFSETVAPRIDSGLQHSIGRMAAETYRMLARLYIQPVDQLGEVKVSALKAERVAQWVTTLMKTPTQKRAHLSAKTVTEAARVLRSVCDLAVARDLLPVNPFTVKDHNGRPVVQLPRKETKRRGALPLDTIDALLAELDAADNAIAPIVRLLIWTGLRIGEALALQWRDVDLQDEVLFVRRSLTEPREGGLHIKAGAKTLAGQRAVALTEDAAALLRALRDRRPKKLSDDALVFPDPRIEKFDFPMSPRQAGKRFTKFVQRRTTLHINGTAPTVHWLRHSFVSHSLMAGADAAVVAAQSGHSTLRVQQIYTDVLLDAKRDAARALQSRLRRSNRQNDR